MRKNIFLFLLFVEVVQPVRAFNRTEMTEMASLASIHLVAHLLPDQDPVSLAKFSMQYAAGIYHPALEAIIFGLQHVYLGDKTALGPSLSMANRAMAQGFADYFNSTETKGYLVAASVDTVSLFLFEHWDYWDTCQCIHDWTIPGALVNSVHQAILGSGYDPVMSGLLTSAATGAMALASSDPFTTAFVAEAGFRLVPSLAKIFVTGSELHSVVNIFGMFLLYRATQMKPGYLQTFTGSTGASFMISALIDMIERFKKSSIVLEG
jgi:hypothetical protein